MFDPFSETPVDGVIAAHCSVQVWSSILNMQKKKSNINVMVFSVKLQFQAWFFIFLVLYFQYVSLHQYVFP